MNVENQIIKTPSSIIWLRRLAWISALLLLISFAVMLISGWGISNTEIIYKASFKLIDRGLANSIHRASHLPVTIFFLAHVLINLKLRIYRKHPHPSLLTDALLVLAGLLILATVFFVEYLV
jgi:hypothetical protein